jgi:hypothetical protein
MVRPARLKGINCASFDPEHFRRTALLTCEPEILEFTEEQNWCDADDDHFRSAIGTSRRSSYFGWRCLIGHVISFRRSEGNGQLEGSRS